MLQKIKRLPVVKNVSELPFFSRPYHFILGFLAAWWYGFPSEKMTIIGVTGTKGKTTTANLIAQILQFSGRKTGLATTVNFMIGDREWVNETKQTMLGRFDLQKLLREMADAGCRYAIIETSSEGIAQYRHRFIDYDTAVFTNISPEHIERHGSFENYRATKVRLFKQLARRKNTFGMYNLDDQNVEFFLEPPIEHKYGFSLATKPEDSVLARKYGVANYLFVSDVQLSIHKTKFKLGKEAFETSLVGEFNVKNAVTAIGVCLALDVPIQRIKDGLRTAQPVPGRFEIVNCGQLFTVVVDYAHEPASLEAAYQAAKLFKPRRIIGLLGAQGGGRDKWKRAVMGKIAAEYCSEIVLTNEDPYDENPEQIIADIAKGITESSKKFKPVYRIPDRRRAIYQAFKLAHKGDVVMLTGKGGEVWMCVEGDRKIAWNERQVVEEVIAEHRDEFVIRSSRSMRYIDEQER